MPCGRSLKTINSRPFFGWVRRHSHRQMPEWDVPQHLSVPDLRHFAEGSERDHMEKFCPPRRHPHTSQAAWFSQLRAVSSECRA